jgi:hypothetical protein
VLAALVCAALPVAAHAGPGATAAKSAGTGSVKGVVAFEGPAPERVKLRRDSDPYCAKTEALAEDIVVTDGKLRDVLVRIRNGSLPRAAPPAAPAVIDQRGCRYEPRVIGVVAGQPLAVRNSDGTFHNVHGEIAGRLIWNRPASPGDPELRLDGSPRAGDVIDVICDVHPWMRAYAVVQDHAAFAVTGDDGAFELTGLPPGSYTLEAWHPALGMQSVTVKIVRGARAAATARFSFKRPDAK